MQLFVVDPDPAVCAKWLDDKRLNKQIIECVQILSHVFNGPYKLTHHKHPIVKWVKSDLLNVAWARLYLKELSCEWGRRTKKPHLSIIKFIIHECTTEFSEETCVAYLEARIKSKGTQPTFCNCTTYKDKDVFTAYQLLLNDKWDNDKREPKWTIYEQ